MDFAAENPWQIPILLAVAEAGAMIWIVVFARWWMRLPVVPYQPRRPAPWRGVHVLAALVVYLALAEVGIAAVHCAGFAEPAATPTPNAKHNIEKMLAGGRGNPWILLTALVTAVVAAPIAEEMFFRVLLQGWLEGAERRGRRLWPSWRVLPGAAPIAVSSILFGVAHYRGSEAASPPTVIAIVTLVGTACELAAIAAIVVFLRRRRGATAADFGWVPEKLAADVRLGLLAAAAAMPLSYLAEWLLRDVLPEGVTPDFLALIPLAAVLGTLYYRTHRLAPSVVAHAAFNAVGLLLWIAGGL